MLWRKIVHSTFALVAILIVMFGVQNYVFALRLCLKEMESEPADHYASLEKLEYLTRDLVNFHLAKAWISDDWAALQVYFS